MKKNNSLKLMSVLIIIVLFSNSYLITVRGYNTVNIDGVYVVEDDSSVTIGNNNIELTFDKTWKGGLDAIIDKKTMVNLRPDTIPLPTLFLFFFDNGTGVEGALQWQAFETNYITDIGSDHANLTIINSNLKGYAIHATTTITIHANDPFVEMRLEIENNEDFTIQNILFPVVWGLGKIGMDSSDDTVFYPAGDGVLLHDPLSKINDLVLSSGYYPGTLSMQLLCHYDSDETGLYFATYDTQGSPKKIHYGPMEWDGTSHLSTSFELYPSETLGNDFNMEYSAIIGTFHGDWYEAADLYKQWADTTPFISGGKIGVDKSIPSWFLDTSIIQFVNRDNPAIEIFSLSDIALMTKEYSTMLDQSITALIIGWEHNGAWVGPYYYPPVEGYQAFQNSMTDLKADGNHGFTYISGTVWRITRDDIGYSDYPLYNSIGLPWTVIQRDQTPYFDPGYESLGWHSARMCQMTDFWHDLVVENALESVQLGCDIVQIDEFPIGSIYPCYNASHGHPVGYSKELSQSYISILQDIRTKGRQINPDFIMSTEEPCELYLPYIDTYVSRDCAPEGLLYMALVDKYGDSLEFIPFFSHVYHEYITSFGEGIGLDEGYAQYFYNQMARALGKMFVTGEIMKVGGTTTNTIDARLFELFSRTSEATTSYAEKYLLKGTALSPAQIYVPLIEIQWYDAIGDKFGTPIYEPAVYTSTWRAPDENIGYFFVNWFTDSIQFNADIDDTYKHGEYVGISLLRNGQRTIINTNTTLPSTISLDMKPNDVILIEFISPVDSVPPERPIIEGPTQGKIGMEYTYTVSSSDNDDDQLYYYIDWGDDETTDWLGPYGSYEHITLSHIWGKEDTFIVKAYVKDEHDVVSDYGSLEVIMPKYRYFNLPFVEIFHKNFTQFLFEHYILGI